MFVLSTELLTNIEWNLLLWFYTKRSGGISFWFVSVQHNSCFTGRWSRSLYVFSDTAHHRKTRYLFIKMYGAPFIGNNFRCLAYWVKITKKTILPMLSVIYTELCGRSLGLGVFPLFTMCHNRFISAINENSRPGHSTAENVFSPFWRTS